MEKFLLESSQKRPLLNMGQEDPFQNGIQTIRRQFWYILDQTKSSFTLPGTCQRGF